MFYTVLSFTYRSWWGGDVGDDDEGHDQGGDDVGDDDVGQHQGDDDVGDDNVGQHGGGDGRRAGGGRAASYDVSEKISPLLSNQTFFFLL